MGDLLLRECVNQPGSQLLRTLNLIAEVWSSLPPSENLTIVCVQGCVCVCVCAWCNLSVLAFVCVCVNTMERRSGVCTKVIFFIPQTAAE